MAASEHESMFSNHKPAKEDSDRRVMIFVASVYAGAALFLVSVLVYVGRIRLALPELLVALAIESAKDWARRFGLS